MVNPTEPKTQYQENILPYAGRHAEIMGMGRQIIVKAGERWNPETQHKDELSFWGFGTVDNKFRYDLPQDEEALALTRLLAAAPDLLAALKALLTFDVELCEEVKIGINHPSSNQARAAIAKAEPQS